MLKKSRDARFYRKMHRLDPMKPVNNGLMSIVRNVSPLHTSPDVQIQGHHSLKARQGCKFKINFSKSSSQGRQHQTAIKLVSCLPRGSANWHLAESRPIACRLPFEVCVEMLRLAMRMRRRQTRVGLQMCIQCHERSGAPTRQQQRNPASLSGKWPCGQRANHMLF